MKNRFVVTVDGLAGSGKTSISRRLAQELGFVHLSTGLVYRAVGLLALEQHVNPDNSADVERLIARHDLELRMIGEGSARSATIFADGRDLGNAVFTTEVSEATSKCARHAAARSALYSVQRDAFPGENLVAEGRDMGTVVFPDAIAKFFIEVSPEIRVRRRIEQMYGEVAKLSAVELKRIEGEMLREIKERDERDSGRDVAPTVAASDAIVIDNSLESLQSVVARLVLFVRQKTQ